MPEQELGLFCFDNHIKWADSKMWEIQQDHKKFVENNFHNYNNLENSNNSLKLTNINSCYPAMNSYQNSRANTPRERSRSRDGNTSVPSGRQSFERTSYTNNKNLF